MTRVKKLLVVAALASAAGAVPALAQAIPAPPPPVAVAHATADPTPLTATAESRELALKLTQLINSEAATRAMVDRMLKETLQPALAQDPLFRELEKRSPGASAEFVSVMTPIILETLSAKMPEYQQTTSIIYAKWLTADDLRTTLAFYASPAGTRLRNALTEHADFKVSLTKQIASLGQEDLTAGDVRADIASSARTAVSVLTSEDQAALIQFASRVDMAKFNRANAEIAEMTANWGNNIDPQTQRKIEVAIAALMERRLAEKKQ
ncbi:MAG: DUF2059 domain-containing protein [Sphingomonas sp.]|uniref:DUF2059 domain-containing protein n=1 Tax=Sphingomonas sp. TaxID=28214 RepID=UPI001B104784|nr:DUF2059 domain-containing protein [Sphingomonas sp.]MBO9621711.1 DUF2059 domain-containing protein [Sphingomonas sp.]